MQPRIWKNLDQDNKIDFVVLWVDGGDPAWQKQRDSYVKKDNITKPNVSTDSSRFRDWDIFRYWFRSVEAFAPWVNKVYLVTWGHTPNWLNINHPKLRIVKHNEFIPEKYLPTFNSNAIELNLHRIDDLAEQFVLFNDDMFLLRPTEESDFFKNGQPRDEMIERAIVSQGKMLIDHTNINNIGIINKHFKKNNVILKRPQKYLSIEYNRHLLFNGLSIPYKHFVGFRNPHLPQSHLKSTFSEIWKIENDMVNNTCQNKFRGYNDISHWLMRYYNLCEGKFIPRSTDFGRCFTLPNEIDRALKYIVNQKGYTVCINDSIEVDEMETIQSRLNQAFRELLPDTCNYEI